MKPEEAIGGALGMGLVIGGGLFALILYWIPTVIALWRNHPQTWPIVLLNLLVGWTGIGWIAALVWSVAAVRR